MTNHQITMSNEIPMIQCSNWNLGFESFIRHRGLDIGN